MWIGYNIGGYNNNKLLQETKRRYLIRNGDNCNQR